MLRLRRKPRRGRPSRPRRGKAPRRGPRLKLRSGPLQLEKAQLRRVRDKEAASPLDEAERQAHEATAAAMEEDEKKIKRETPPGGSCADGLQRSF